MPRFEQGDPQATAELLPVVYEELRRLARAHVAHERAGHTLQATALVHEAYLRLVKDANHIGMVAATSSRGRRSHAAHSHRARSPQERHQARRPAQRVELDEDLPAIAAPCDNLDDLLAVNEALDQLAPQDPAKAEIGQVALLRRLESGRSRGRTGHLAHDRLSALGFLPGRGCTMRCAGKNGSD